MSEYVHCWEWERSPESHTTGVDYWGHYPGAAENYDTHEVRICFWKVEDDEV